MHNTDEGQQFPVSGRGAGPHALLISLTTPAPAHQNYRLCAAWFECQFSKSYSGEMQDDKRATFFPAIFYPLIDLLLLYFTWVAGHWFTSRTIRRTVTSN